MAFSLTGGSSENYKEKNNPASTDIQTGSISVEHQDAISSASAGTTFSHQEGLLLDVVKFKVDSEVFS